jgi:DNA-binding NarL/FixJ family response regulator
MIEVFVIASTPMVQAGLRTMLISTNIRVVGESSLPDAFTEDLANIDVIVVADEVLLEEVGRSLSSPGSPTMVGLIALANMGDERVLRLLRGLELRGWGVVPLDAPATQLQAAVEAVAQGMVVVPTNIASQLYERFTRVETIEAASLDVPDESLTTREREVLELVSQGLSNKLIARRLQISEHTVKFHVSSISSKLGASSRTDAVSRGLRRGLITL